jgi:hypothetical protein
MADSRVLADGKFVALASGGTWPTPMDHPDGGLEWRLRYASPEQLIKDRYLAASIVDAYRGLITCPAKRRNEVIRELRKAMKAPQAQHTVSQLK